MNRHEFEEAIASGVKYFEAIQAIDFGDGGFVKKGELLELKEDDKSNTPAFYFPNREKRDNYHSMSRDWQYFDLKTLKVPQEYTIEHEEQSTEFTFSSPQEQRDWLKELADLMYYYDGECTNEMCDTFKDSLRILTRLHIVPEGTLERYKELYALAHARFPQVGDIVQLVSEIDGVGSLYVPQGTIAKITSLTENGYRITLFNNSDTEHAVTARKFKVIGKVDL